MKLVKCKGGRQCRAPAGSIYIGRPMPGLDGSPLRNPFRRKGDAKVDGIDVDGKPYRLIERYRRHLTWKLAVEDWSEVPRELRRLARGSALACWCVDRPAQLVTGEVEGREDYCHGDVVFTVWTGLERLGWRWRRAPVERCSAEHAELYEACFGLPLEWKGSR